MISSCTICTEAAKIQSRPIRTKAAFQVQQSGVSGQVLPDLEKLHHPIDGCCAFAKHQNEAEKG